MVSSIEKPVCKWAIEDSPILMIAHFHLHLTIYASYHLPCTCTGTLLNFAVAKTNEFNRYSEEYEFHCEDSDLLEFERRVFYSRKVHPSLVFGEIPEKSLNFLCRILQFLQENCYRNHFKQWCVHFNHLCATWVC